MIDIFTGFAVIALAVFVGWLAARVGVLGPGARPVLAKLNFNVLAPFLLFSVLATADVRSLFSALLPVSALAAITMMLVFALVSLAAWRRGLPRTVIGSLAAGYVNGNNFGIPIAVYMLGDAAYSAPVVLLQLLLFAPLALAVLGATVEGRTSAWVIVRSTLTNPIIVGSLLGVLVAVTGIELPPIVLEPIELIGHAAVPLMLIAYGLSLHGQRLELIEEHVLGDDTATMAGLRSGIEGYARAGLAELGDRLGVVG
ncbi:AEC family transporter [Agromyces humi]|uniref:AEC family transporter n=1 Tax=Agromyces humi TaxID=1766800 RepID=UPI001358C6D6|nr:AEC family transporter [Agromyces humi]